VPEAAPRCGGSFFMKIINVFANDTVLSRDTKKLLKRKLEKSEFVVPREYDPGAELIICIGGDGSFLESQGIWGSFRSCIRMVWTNLFLNTNRENMRSSI